MDETVQQLGEFGLIQAVTARLPQGPSVQVGPGDDGAVLRAGDDPRVVVTMDLLVEGWHFRRDWSTGYDVGRKAAAQNLSDIAAMGASPTALVVGLAAPPELPARWALELTDGLREECQPLGVSVVGGDTVRSLEVTVAVTALGGLTGRDPVTRAGARPGDLLAVAGRLGWAAAGLALLSRGLRRPEPLVDAHRRPRPPYRAGPAAAAAGATAMIDVSDGLLADLGHLAAASRVRIAVNSAAVARTEPLQEAADLLNASPLEWVLTGGDDHALAATFPAGTALPPSWRAVGMVTEGQGVVVDGEPWRSPAGWDHFA